MTQATPGPALLPSAPGDPGPRISPPSAGRQQHRPAAPLAAPLLPACGAYGRPAMAPPAPWMPPNCTRRERPPRPASDPEPPGPAPLPSLLPRIRQHRFCSKTFGDFWSGVAILAGDCPRGPRGAAGPSPPASRPARPGGPAVPRSLCPPRAPQAPGVPKNLRPRGNRRRQGRHFNGTRRNCGRFPQCPTSSGRAGPPVRWPKGSPRCRRAFLRPPAPGPQSSGTNRSHCSLHGLLQVLRPQKCGH